MQILDGRAMALKIREEVRSEIQSSGRSFGLGVLLVGNDQASRVYVDLKEKASVEAGIKTDIRRLPEQASDDELIRVIQSWNEDHSIQGILVQLPLPFGHDVGRVIMAIDPNKDVDGFHPVNIEKAKNGEAIILPPVHEAVIRFLGASGIDPRGKSATILANSDTFSDPLVRLLQKAGFITAVMSPDHLEAEVLRPSHVIITAVGRPGFLASDLVSQGTIVIDIGITKGDDGKVYGDADAGSLAKLEGWLTPVPGGVGPMTVALLLKNVVRLGTGNEPNSSFHP
jgi:methylenetetrahydrofolate dehydrogenase (NADP+)/methenyltetrahydrofolate cyclohydrolase